MAAELLSRLRPHINGLQGESMQELSDDVLIEQLRREQKALQDLGIDDDIGGTGIVYGAMRYPYDEPSDTHLSPMQRDTTLRITPINCMSVLLYRNEQILDWEMEAQIQVFHVMEHVAYIVQTLFYRHKDERWSLPQEFGV